MRFSLLTAAGLASLAAAQCNRATILEMADKYIAAQEAGSLSSIEPLFADSFTYRENNKAASIDASLLNKALALDHKKSLADTTQCATYSELISTKGPYVIGTQIHYSEDGSQIKSIDTIAATTGDWFFNPANTLRYVAAEDWNVIPPASRSARDVLKAAGDAYLDMWGRTGAIDEVPWGNPCSRTEGAMHVTPDCRAGAPRTGSAGMAIKDRRYVIDEEIGSCSILCAFAGGLPDSHEFRLVDGKVVLVHTITV